MIQRMAEEFEYCDLLHQAAACDDPSRQMVYVVAFVVSSIAPTVGRTTKPFNPLLGTHKYIRAVWNVLVFARKRIVTSTLLSGPYHILLFIQYCI